MGCGHKAAQHDARPQDGGRHCGIRRPRDLGYTRRHAGAGQSRSSGQSCKGWKKPRPPVHTKQRRVEVEVEGRGWSSREKTPTKGGGKKTGRNFKSVSRRQQQNIKIKNK